GPHPARRRRDVPVRPAAVPVQRHADDRPLTPRAAGAPGTVRAVASGPLGARPPRRPSGRVRRPGSAAAVSRFLHDMTTTTAGHRTGARSPLDPPARLVPVVVIGAGQAGLSAAYHLRRRGLGYVVLDGEDGPGGAWRHRWRSLRMATVNGIFDLPGMPRPPADPGEPAADAVPRYFAAYERELGLPVLRPVRVHAVGDVAGGRAGGGRAETGGVDGARAEAGTGEAGGAGGTPGGLLVETSHGAWTARAVINATGTWTAPNWPWYPGAETFAGRQ